jgi:hypothetical protein
MSFESSFYFYLYAGTIFFILLLGSFVYFLKRKYGNVFFLTEGSIKISESYEVKIRKVLPFMGEGYLIFVEISSPKGKYAEIWGYSKNGGFRKISTIEDK